MADLSRFQRSQPGEASQRARDADFPIVLRGYDRQSVDRYVEEMAQLLDSLEATQTRETVVQRALDEVGEQTSGILQRAHETAEEITARSRAKAEGRLQRAEREADLLRRDADDYADRIVADTRVLWEERQRLIEEMRQLADEVLGTADDAAERLGEPEMLRRRPAEPHPDPEDEGLADATTVMPALNGDEGAVDDAPYDLAAQDPALGAAPPAGEQPTEEVEVPWLAGDDPEQADPDETLPLPPSRFEDLEAGYQQAMDEREHTDDQADREAAAAAAEAAAIGGHVDDESDDPAERAVLEGGGGEAEGFEESEEELVEHASHGDSGPDPSHMAGEPELESDRETAVDGDADDLPTSERPSDD